MTDQLQAPIEVTVDYDETSKSMEFSTPFGASIKVTVPLGEMTDEQAMTVTLMIENLNELMVDVIDTIFGDDDEA